MAVVHRLCERRARAVPPAEPQPARPTRTADIVILPCIRRERIVAECRDDELPTQRQA